MTSGKRKQLARPSVRPARLTNRTSSECFDEKYQTLLKLYASAGEPITVNFRDLVQLPAGADRATHLIHPYPAKLLVNIPYFFVNCATLSQPGQLVLDPFCGTGTVLLEAVLAKRKAMGADANPLARLITRVKLRQLDVSKLDRQLADALARARRASPMEFSPVVDVDRWYSTKTARALGRLLSAVRAFRDSNVREFFEVCFSCCVKRLSYADPRLSVPVRLKPENNRLSSPGIEEVLHTFEQVCSANIARMTEAAKDLTVDGAVKISNDARLLGNEAKETAKLVVTSPPYSSAQKYVRSSTLSLGWLGLAPADKLRNLERLNIGREHFSMPEREKRLDSPVESARDAIDKIRSVNPLRAHIVTTYLIEMQAAWRATVDALAPGGHLVLVIGDNTICKTPFATGSYLSEMLVALGMVKKLELVDPIRSRGLMTKRNKTAGLISQEHIHVFQKQA